MDTIVVNDTNVFIDLYSIDLLDTFFELPHRIHTTDFVMAELVDEEQSKKVEAFKLSGHLIIKTYEARELAELAQFHTQQENNVSMADCSVWLYAQKNHYRLLTGDNKLRKSAIKSGTLVSGILYVFDQLVEQKLLLPQAACDKLNLLRKINNRLPDKDIAERLKRWSDSTK